DENLGAVMLDLRLVQKAVLDVLFPACRIEDLLLDRRVYDQLLAHLVGDLSLLRRLLLRVVLIEQGFDGAMVGLEEGFGVLRSARRRCLALARLRLCWFRCVTAGRWGFHVDVPLFLFVGAMPALLPWSGERDDRTKVPRFARKPVPSKIAGGSPRRR